MSFIKTFSGKHFYYDRINKDDIVINDIAVSLSNICRFAGHLSHFYSVAQHAVLCSMLVPQEFAFEALMHDATEAYCQDIPAPLKRLLPDYKRMEEKIDAVIREKYGLPQAMSTPVKYADLIMLATERRDLGLDDGSFWPVLEGIPATEMFNVIPLAPGHAYGMFMERFNELSDVLKMDWPQIMDKGIFIQQGKTGVKQIKAWTDRLRAAVDICRSWGETGSVIKTMYGERYSYKGFNEAWRKARTAAANYLGRPLDCTFHDLKAKGISDYEGSSKEKQLFSGHKTESQVMVYDRKIRITPTLNKN